MGIYKIKNNKKRNKWTKYWGYIKQKTNKKKTPPNKKYSMWTKNSQFNNLTIIKESWPLRRLKDLIYRYLKGSTLVEVKGKRKLNQKEWSSYSGLHDFAKRSFENCSSVQDVCCKVGFWLLKADSLLQHHCFPSSCSS